MLISAFAADRTYKEGHRNCIGIAYMGGACNTNGYGISISELTTNFKILKNGKWIKTNNKNLCAVYVHELGHNLGMK